LSSGTSTSSERSAGGLRKSRSLCPSLPTMPSKVDGRGSSLPAPTPSGLPTGHGLFNKLDRFLYPSKNSRDPRVYAWGSDPYRAAYSLRKPSKSSTRRWSRSSGLAALRKTARNKPPQTGARLGRGSGLTRAARRGRPPSCTSVRLVHAAGRSPP
jgi:hypothetical protein